MDKDTIWVAHESDDPGDIDEPPPIPSGGDEHRVMLCRRCHLPRVFRRRGTRHSVHFMLALGTLGLWLPVWGIVIIHQRLKPWTCSVCGVHQRND